MRSDSTRIDWIPLPRRWSSLQVAGATLLSLALLSPLAVLAVAHLIPFDDPAGTLRIAVGTFSYCAGMAFLLLNANAHRARHQRRALARVSSMGSSLCGECPTCGAEAAWSPDLGSCPVCGY